MGCGFSLSMACRSGVKILQASANSSLLQNDGDDNDDDNDDEYDNDDVDYDNDLDNDDENDDNNDNDDDNNHNHDDDEKAILHNTTSKDILNHCT